MISIGIDPSTKTGIVACEYDEEKSTIRCIDQKKVVFTQLKGMERANAIGDGVLSFVELYRPDIIFIEDYGFSFKGTAITLVEIGTMIRYNLWVNDFNYEVVTPTSLKKFVTGKGNSPKDLIIKEVYKRWNFDTNDNDIADAFSMAMFGLAVSGKLIMPKLNRDAISAWLKSKK